MLSTQSKSRYTVIAGGSGNLIDTLSDYSSINGGFGNTIAFNSGSSTVSGGQANLIGRDASFSLIGGGTNTIDSGSSLSVVFGGSLNTIGKNSAVSTIAGGTSNTISDNTKRAAILGGTNLRAQSYAQTVIGRFNAPQGTSTESVINEKDRIFIIGKGTHDTLRSNAFEVSNNGHSLVYHTNGEAQASIKGGTFTDNVIYAWGYYNYSWHDQMGEDDFDVGNNNCLFGVDTIHYKGTGDYKVFLNIKDQNDSSIHLDSNCISVVVTMRDFRNSCPIARVTDFEDTAHYTSFRIKVTQPAITGCPTACILDCQPVNQSLSFIVVGRCREEDD